MTFPKRNIVRKRNLTLRASRRNTPCSFLCHCTRIAGSKPTHSTWEKGLDVLGSKGLETSRRELVEAGRDITRRPEPDLTGAVQHSRAALECVAREVAGHRDMTLSKILSQPPDILPDTHLKEAALKLWDCASDRGVHLREGDSPTYTEAKLIVVRSWWLCLYLARKYEPNKHKLN